MSFFPIPAEKFGVGKDRRYQSHQKLDRSLRNRKETKSRNKKIQDRSIEELKTKYREILKYLAAYLVNTQLTKSDIDIAFSLLIKDKIISEFEVDVFKKTKEFTTLIKILKENFQGNKKLNQIYQEIDISLK